MFNLIKIKRRIREVKKEISDKTEKLLKTHVNFLVTQKQHDRVVNKETKPLRDELKQLKSQEQFAFPFWMLIATWIIALAAIGALITNFILSSNVYKSEFRPYIGIKNFALLDLNPSHFEVRAVLENTGRVPANNVNVELFQVLGDGSLQVAPDETVRQGIVLMPSAPQNYILRANVRNLDLLISSDQGWSMILEVKYDGIATKKHTSSIKVKYDSILGVFDIVGGFAD